MSFKCLVTEVEWTAYPVPRAWCSAVGDVLTITCKFERVEPVSQQSEITAKRAALTCIRCIDYEASKCLSCSA